MKKRHLLTLAALCTLSFGKVSAQKDFKFDKVSYVGAFGVGSAADWTKPWTEFDPKNVVYPGDADYKGPQKELVTVSSDITSNTTWDSSHYYILKGAIHVKNNATLTIAPGTVIRGNKIDAGDTSTIGFLMITRGSKIYAKGTPQKPIVFTSDEAPGVRERGDWAGLMIMGYAPMNLSNKYNSAVGYNERNFEALPNDPLSKYGGKDSDDSSGVLDYVRCEFAGWAYLQDQEINSITFAGVGRKTVASHLQSSFGNDDSFEWFGGTVNHKWLVAFAGTDDDFDMDEGFNGKLQYLLGVRHPDYFDASASGASNAFEHDDNTGLCATNQNVPGNPFPNPFTRPIISNATLVGPLKSGWSKKDFAAIKPLSATAATKFNRAFNVRTNAATNIFNTIAIGYIYGAAPDHKNCAMGNYTSGDYPSVYTKMLGDTIAWQNIILGGNDKQFNATNLPTGASLADSVKNFDIKKWFTKAAFSNDTTFSNTNAKGNGVSTGQTSGEIGLVRPFAIDSATVKSLDFTLKTGSPAAMKAAAFTHRRLSDVWDNVAYATSVTAIEKGLIINDEVVLFPNPSNGSSTLSFNLSKSTSMSISVVNSAGVIVKEVNNGTLSSGNHQFTISGLDAGFYFVKMTTGGNSAAVKYVVY